MYRVFLILLFCVLSLFAKDYKQNLASKDKKVVNIMLGFDKPPFIFGQSSAKGIEPDLLKEAFKIVGYEVNILQGRKDEQEVVLHQENHIDAVATISQKDDGLYYSDDFTTYENYVVTRKKDNYKIDSIEDLKNIKFVTWKNAYNDLGDKFYRLFNPIDGKYKSSYNDTSTQIDGTRTFFSKKVDVIIVDKDIFNWHKLYFKNNEEYVFHDVLEKKENINPITFRDEKVRDDFNIGLNILKQSGRYDEIIKFYKTQDIKELMKLAELLANISSKYIFENKKQELIDILKHFFIHPDIEAIAINTKNSDGLYIKLARVDNKIVLDNSFNVEDLQKVPSKIYYTTEYDLLKMGDLSVYYKKEYKTKNGKIIPFLESLKKIKSKNYNYIKDIYKKYNIEFNTDLALTKEEKEYLENHKTITVHNENGWAPYNYNKNGVPRGFSIDYMDLIAKKLNINIKYIQGYKWSEYLKLMEQEKIDILANVASNEERKKYINFTTPYLESKKAIFSNIPNIKNISDLNGKTVALPEHFYIQYYLEKNYPNIKIKAYPNTKESLYAVINKEADALIENYAVVDSLMKKNGLSLPYVTLNDSKELSSDLKIGVRRSQVILRDIIQKAKDSILEEEFIALENKWFGVKKQTKQLFTTEEAKYIENKKIINVCFHRYQYPWAIKSGNSITGSSIEYLKHISKKSKLKFEMLELNTPIEHFNAMQSAKCDVSPIVLTKPNNFNFLTPTIPIVEDNIVLVTKITEPYVNDLKDITNKKVGIQKETKNLTKYVKQLYPNIELVELEGFQLNKVASGKLYGYIGASYQLSYKISSSFFNELKVMSKVGEKKVNGSFGITIREPVLLSIFNKSIADMSKLEKQQINNAWLSVEIEKQFDYVLFIQIISVFVVIFLILFISNIKEKKLHQQIKKLNEGLEETVKLEVQKNREKEKLMLRQSRLAQMGEVISMIAHQWRQPLNSLSLLNQTIILKYNKEKLNDEVIEYFKENSKKQIDQMSKTVDDFRDFFKPQKVKSEFCLNDIIINTVDIVKPLFLGQNIVIDTTMIQSYRIVGYENELGQAILNILNNSKDALIEKGTKNKQISLQLKNDNQAISLVISDNAGGIPKDIIDKIFDPYFSTKGEKNGTGLGLYMTKIIIEEHMEADLKVSNNKLGAMFTITFNKQ